MAITREDVLHVARLARLGLDDAEVDRLAADLEKIVAYVNELAEVDTEGVPPTAQVSVERAPLRLDVPSPGLDPALALAEAPRASDRAFAVPAFVDES